MFEKKIRPAFDDYVSDPKNQRLANILAGAVDSHAEWTFEYHKQNDFPKLAGANNPMDFREATFGKCPATKMMWDLAEADRHRFLTMERRVPRTVTASTAAYSIKNDELWVNQYDTPFLPQAKAAVEYWKKWPD